MIRSNQNWLEMGEYTLYPEHSGKPSPRCVITKIIHISITRAKNIDLVVKPPHCTVLVSIHVCMPTAHSTHGYLNTRCHADHASAVPLLTYKPTTARNSAEILAELLPVPEFTFTLDDGYLYTRSNSISVEEKTILYIETRSTWLKKISVVLPKKKIVQSSCHLRSFSNVGRHQEIIVAKLYSIMREFFVSNCTCVALIESFKLEFA